MDHIDLSIGAVCTAYAQLRCDARRLQFEDDRSAYAEALEGAALFLLRRAPGASGPALDVIKRILEIDTATTSCSKVLMRASVMVSDRWRLRTDKPSDPDAGSDLKGTSNDA